MPDHDLSTLNPAVPILVGGERVFIRSVTLDEIPAAQRVRDGWRLLVATGGDFLHAEAWADFIDLCAAAAGRDRLWLDALPEADFEKVICSVVAINEELWKPENLGEASEEISWAAITQRLVEHGHSLESTRKLTLPQARALLKECVNQETNRFAQAIQAATFAMVSPKDAEKAVRKLRHG